MQERMQLVLEKHQRTGKAYLLAKDEQVALVLHGYSQA